MISSEGGVTIMNKNCAHREKIVLNLKKNLSQGRSNGIQMAL